MFTPIGDGIQQEIIMPCFEAALSTALLCGTLYYCPCTEESCNLRTQLAADDIVRAQSVVDLAKSRNLAIDSGHSCKCLQVTSFVRAVASVRCHPDYTFLSCSS